MKKFCPRCKGNNISTVKKEVKGFNVGLGITVIRKYYWCRDCKYNFTSDDLAEEKKKTHRAARGNPAEKPDTCNSVSEYWKTNKDAIIRNWQRRKKQGYSKEQFINKTCENMFLWYKPDIPIETMRAKINRALSE